MAYPFESIPSDTSAPLQLLLAPLGWLSGDGQLHELMRERRRHDAPGRGLRPRHRKRLLSLIHIRRVPRIAQSKITWYP